MLDLPLNPEEFSRAGMVDFAVDRDSDLPVGTQLVWKLRAMIARGAVREGDRLPSVRELADFAGVNVNTARATYLLLEREGCVASEQGRGTYVTERAATTRGVGELVGEVLAAARREGIDFTELAAVIWAAGEAERTAQLPAPPLPQIDPDADAPQLRRALRAQIARLEAELAPYAWHDRADPPPERVETAVPVPRLASVEELQRTLDGLVERLMRLRGEAERRGAREQRARQHVESMVKDPNAHRWEVVTSGETGDPEGRSWRVVPRFGPFGAILGWWRVKVSAK